MHPQQSYYDQWGRPIIPPQQYQQQQQIPQHLETRFNKMEQMLYGGYNPNQGTQNNNGNANYSPNQANSVPTQTQTALIPVGSFDEAWNRPPDYSGAKQYYINESAGEIYVIYVDSNIDKVKDIYKKETPQAFTEEPQQMTDPLIPVIERLHGIESEVLSIKNMLKNSNPVIIDEPEPLQKTKPTRDKSGRYQKRGGV